MFPKKGNNFPNGPRIGKGKVTYPAAIGAALRAELGDSHRAVKTAMRWTGANERTVKNWIAGRTGPRGEHLLGLIRHSNLAFEVVLQLAGREQAIAEQALRDARGTLADSLAKIDAWIGGPEGKKRGF